MLQYQHITLIPLKTMQRITISIPTHTYEAIKQAASKDNRPISNYLRNHLELAHKLPGNPVKTSIDPHDCGDETCLDRNPGYLKGYEKPL